MPFVRYATAMLLKVTPELFAKFPETRLGVVIAHGVNNAGQHSDVLEMLRLEQRRLLERLGNTPIPEHPHVAPWREAYRAFGAKPKDHPSSIENLVRRVSKGHALPHINTVVDLYNTISLRHFLPVGGENLDALHGDILLTIASDHEAPVTLLGEKEARPPYPGEVIYKDDVGAICRRWNWKEAERSKLTESTKNLFLVIETLPPVPQAVLQQATTELATLVQTYCGGKVKSVFLYSASPQTALE
jgi:DNA/RNA-binding domain of Phe-tRNA-synthetase-like protein